MDKGTPNRPSRLTLFYFISAFWGKKGLTCSALQGLSFMGFPAHGEAGARAARSCRGRRIRFSRAAHSGRRLRDARSGFAKSGKARL